MKKNAKKILVTGAAGFIGYHVCAALLSRGWNVVGVDSLNDYYDPRLKRARLAILKKNRTFTFYKADFSNFSRFETIVKKEQPGQIIHLGAQAGVRYSFTNPQAYISSNEIGTFNVFEAARRHSISRVIYASSSSVYGANTKQPFSEDDRTDSQVSLYAATKKANEILAHTYSRLFGMELIGLRFFTVYGEWSRPDMTPFKFVYQILKGETIDIYNRGKMKRSFTHISDVVAGIMAIVDSKPQKKDEIYNLGGSETVPLLRFIERIETELGVKVKKRLLPMQRGDMQETVADCSKAKRDLGYRPRVSIEEGIKEFVSWFRTHEKFLLSLKEPKQ